MNKSMQLEASLHPEIVLEIKDAENSVAQQVKQIEGFIKDDVSIFKNEVNINYLFFIDFVTHNECTFCLSKRELMF